MLLALCSLQLYVGQYLVFMAPDNRGFLTLVPGYAEMNLFATFLLFVFVSREIHVLTLRLCSLTVKLFEHISSKIEMLLEDVHFKCYF